MAAKATTATKLKGGLKAKLAALKKENAPKAKTETKAKVKSRAKAKKAPERRQKAIGFEFKKTDKNAMESGYAELEEKFNEAGEMLGEFLEGKKIASTRARGALKDIMDVAKALRKNITEAKASMTPIYKED